MSIGGHTVKQLPQYMHFSSLIVTVFSFGLGLIADVGHDATVVGISHTLDTSSLLIVGTFLCTATTAMSEQ
jgi:hypothetical protein